MRITALLFVTFLSFGYCYAQPAPAGMAKPGEAGEPVDSCAEEVAGPVIIRNISITGNKHTKTYIVMREVALKQGDAYTRNDFNKKLRLTKEQLMNTGLFVTVTADTINLGGGEAELLVDVKERWYLFPVPYFKVIDRNWNVWINDYNASLNRVNFGLKVMHGNTSGRNDKFNLFLIGGYTQQFSCNYSLPYFDKSLQHGFNMGLSYSQNREVNVATKYDKQVFLKLDGFAKQTVKADLGYSYRRGSDFRMGAKMTYVNEKFDNEIIKYNPNLLGAGRNQASYFDLFYSLQLLKADYNPYPLRGYYVDLYGLKRFGKALGLMQVGGRAQATWPVLKKTYINFQGAFAVNLQQEEPYYNQHMMGYGSMYMQGLEYNVVDGTFGAMIRTTLRHELFGFHIRKIVKNKAHSDIPVRVFVKTYGNLGYAHNKFSDPVNIMPNRLLRTGGFGIDILTIYDLVLKLEYSFNQFGQNGLFVHTASDF